MLKKFKKKIWFFIPIFLFPLILFAIWAMPILKNEATTNLGAVSQSQAVQLRKINLQIKKLQAILADLQKTQANQTKITQTKSSAPVLATKSATPATNTTSANKALLPGIIPFGGKITLTVPCGCSGNLLITQLPVAGPPVMIFQPGPSTLYAYSQLLPGAWILGDILGTAPCIQGVPPFCAFVGDYPLIKIVGTSGAPGTGAIMSGVSGLLK